MDIIFGSQTGESWVGGATESICKFRAVQPRLNRQDVKQQLIATTWFRFKVLDVELEAQPRLDGFELGLQREVVAGAKAGGQGGQM